eukprot:TRINITY_DN4324_c0_g1_i1.p1 TRINITY_DN4324_c0_g1~~TRINITY_DN4324_c0_g1_i1.p1  ORF type:complete len:393 (-),score=69.85 TRINITY_DN4324_c0_g1_i1:110-1288(-)
MGYSVLTSALLLSLIFLTFAQYDEFDVLSKGAKIFKENSKLWQTFNKLHQDKLRKRNIQSIEPQTAMVPMRDGVKLHTVYWAIFDEFKYSTVIIRSPYGYGKTEDIAYIYVPFGYAVVMQDQRGTGQSEGNWTFWKTTANDGYDTLAWIAAQPWSNGKVYEAGASADGILTYLGMQVPQPHMHGQFILFSNSLMYYTVFQGKGAYREELVTKWLGKMQEYRPKAPSYVHEVLEHEGFAAWWLPDMLYNLSNVNFRSIQMGGWYDIFIGPMITSFENYQKYSDPSVRGKHQMIIGPRGHCFYNKDESNFSFAMDLFDYIWSIEASLDIFGIDDHLTAEEKYLKDQYSATASLGKLTLYVIGANSSWWLGEEEREKLRNQDPNQLQKGIKKDGC